MSSITERLLSVFSPGTKNLNSVTPPGTKQAARRASSLVTVIKNTRREQKQGVVPTEMVDGDRTDGVLGHPAFEGEEISLDQYRARIQGKQEIKDGDFYQPEVEGSVPCDVVGRKRSGTKGRSGNKRWWA